MSQKQKVNFTLGQCVTTVILVAADAMRQETFGQQLALAAVSLVIVHASPDTHFVYFCVSFNVQLLRQASVCHIQE